jgi:cell division protease FtsH
MASENQRELHFNFWYLCIALLAFMFFQQWWYERQSVETVAYSEFMQMVESGQISSIQVSNSTIRGTLSADSEGRTKYVDTVRVETGLAEVLERYDVEFSGKIENNLISNIFALIMPALLFIAIWLFVIRRMASQQMGAGGLMSIGKSKAKIFVETDIRTTFDDVAGVDEAKDELKEVIEFLKRPEEYGRLGAHVPKGILLVGPPGTGKTLLARAIAGEAGVPFFSINGSEFVELFVGVGAARVRDLFEQARQSAPCIIFIDELDALGRARGSGPLSGGHDEKEQTLNQLLSELDGFDTGQGIVLLSATNRPEILDPALLRAGRFDRQVLVDRPDKAGRIAILEIHARSIRLAPGVSFEEIAALTPGFSGADLANLVNEAAIVATRRSADEVTIEDFTAAIERIVAGLEKKSRILIPRERKRVAYHEAGHAIVTIALQGPGSIQKISIIPRGVGALGYNIQKPTEDRYLMTSDELQDKMSALLAGRAAEELVFSKPSTGAADDLDKATEIARSMATHYGMHKALGLATYDDMPSPFLGKVSGSGFSSQHFSDQTAAAIDDAIRQLLNKAFDLATAILVENRTLLDDTAAKLLKEETLAGDALPSPHWKHAEDQRVRDGPDS